MAAWGGHVHPPGRAHARAHGLSGDTVPRKRLSVTPATPLEASFGKCSGALIPNEGWPTRTTSSGEGGQAAL